MTDLQIPGYEGVIPNRTFVKEVKPTYFEKCRQILEAKRILQLSRFVIPSKDAILKCIQTSLREYNPGLENESKTPEDEMMDKLISILSPDISKRILEGEDAILAHLKKHSREYPGAGKSYLQLVSGVVPDGLLASLEMTILQNGPLVYETLVNEVKKRDWYFSLDLGKIVSLPNPQELYDLLNRKEKECRLFSVDVDAKNYNSFAKQVKKVYTVLQDRENLEQIVDCTEMIVKRDAIASLNLTSICEAGRKLIMGLFEGIDGLPGSNSIPRKQTGYGDYCSNN